MRSSVPFGQWYLLAALLVLAQAVILLVMGRVPICECGYIRVFEPGVNTAGNSQHLSDWYTPSHILHGVAFYALTYLVFRRKPLAFRFCLAVLLEGAWEVLENTPMVIDHYRQETISIGYTGDSVLNSVMDTLFMALGFLFAARAPIWLTVAVFLVFEITAAVIIRDGLILNVIMLIQPIEAIKAWQAGG